MPFHQKRGCSLHRYFGSNMQPASPQRFSCCTEWSVNTALEVGKMCLEKEDVNLLLHSDMLVFFKVRASVAHGGWLPRRVGASEGQAALYRTIFRVL